MLHAYSREAKPGSMGTELRFATATIFFPFSLPPPRCHRGLLGFIHIDNASSFNRVNGAGCEH